MSQLIAAFPARSEFEKARARLDALSLPHQAVSPDPSYTLVGVPSLVMEPGVRMRLAARRHLVKENGRVLEDARRD